MLTYHADVVFMCEGELMSENRWMIQIEKSAENKITICFGGRLQLALKPLLGWLSSTLVAVALIQYWH